ncbi:MAG: hypothetical protein V4703_12820 [Actinomycetota bacterium]
MPAVAKKPANGKTPAKAAKAALAELADASRISHFRGVALMLPPKLPATFALDMAEVQASQGQQELGPTYTLLVGLLGRGQWRKVRDKIAEDGDSMEQIGDVLQEVFKAIMDPYDVTPGESPASATS